MKPLAYTTVITGNLLAWFTKEYNLAIIVIIGGTIIYQLDEINQKLK